MNLEFCEFEIRRGFQEFVSHIKSGLLWSEHLLRAGPPLWVPKKQKALPHPGGARGPCRSPLLYPTSWKPLMWVRPGKGQVEDAGRSLAERGSLGPGGDRMMAGGAILAFSRGLQSREQTRGRRAGAACRRETQSSLAVPLFLSSEHDSWLRKSVNKHQLRVYYAWSIVLCPRATSGNKIHKIPAVMMPMFL